MHISKRPAHRGKESLRVARSLLRDRYAVPHLWVSQELHFASADWQSQRAEEGQWVSDRPVASVPAWHPA